MQYKKGKLNIAHKKSSVCVCAARVACIECLVIMRAVKPERRGNAKNKQTSFHEACLSLSLYLTCSWGCVSILIEQGYTVVLHIMVLSNPYETLVPLKYTEYSENAS